MAVLVTIDYQQVPYEDYDAMLPDMDPEFRAAAGFMAHAGVTTEGGLQVVEIWESRGDFESWMTDTLIPVLERNDGTEPPYTVQEIRGLVLADRP